jgi:hypothetical protein
MYLCVRGSKNPFENPTVVVVIIIIFDVVDREGESADSRAVCAHILSQ